LGRQLCLGWIEFKEGNVPQGVCCHDFSTKGRVHRLSHSNSRGTSYYMLIGQDESRLNEPPGPFSSWGINKEHCLPGIVMYLAEVYVSMRNCSLRCLGWRQSDRCWCRWEHQGRWGWHGRWRRLRGGSWRWRCGRDGRRQGYRGCCWQARQNLLHPLLNTPVNLFVRRATGRHRQGDRHQPCKRQ
jgi:hypothetical protein